MTRRYDVEEVTVITSRHLAQGEIARCVVACIRKPEAFEGVDGLLDAQLARHFLEVANGILNREESDEPE
jgi:hypothetical protein